MKFFWAATALLLVISLGLFLVFVRLSDASVFYLATLSFNLTAFGLFLSFMVLLHSKNRNSGAVLIDCGPNPRRLIFLFFAAGLGVSYAYDVSKFSTVAAGFSPELLLSVCIFYLALGRLQFKQNGLWRYGLFAPWRNVVSYEWVDVTTLKVEVRGLIHSFPSVSLQIPSSQKQIVSDLLAEHLSDIR